LDDWKDRVVEVYELYKGCEILAGVVWMNRLQKNTH